MDTRDPNERIEISFLAVYYQLNTGYADLLRVRATTPGPERGVAERRVLQRIERALRRRDALEDYHAPFGVIAEPMIHDGFAVDVRFTFGTVNHEGRLRSQGYRMSAYVPLPQGTGHPAGRTAGMRHGLATDGKADSDELPSAG